MNSNKILFKAVSIPLIVIILMITIGFIERKHDGKVCNRIFVNIENQLDTYFIDEEDVIKLMTQNNTDLIIGRQLSELDLRKVEQRVRQHKFVQNAEVYKDLKGNVHADVAQWKPLARIIQSDGPDAYIGPEGQILPTSDKFTARVVLVSGEATRDLISNDLSTTELGKGLLGFIEYIYQDEFWKAQVAEIEVNKEGELTLYTQVSKQYVEFGKPDDLEAKFNKLRIFYKDILPQKGWNNYVKVSLKYHNQIVCE